MTQRIASSVEQDLVERYLNGQRVIDIEADTGVSRASIYNVLSRCGIERVRLVGPPFREFTAQELATIKIMRERGDNSDVICAELHTSLVTLRRAYKALGLSLSKKPRHDAKDRVYRTGGYVYVLLERDDPFAEMAQKSGTSRYVCEHRIVMARHLGRPLRPTETVHHINAVRDDNRLENLQLRQGKHGKGSVLRCLDCGSHNVGPMPLA